MTPRGLVLRVLGVGTLLGAGTGAVGAQLVESPAAPVNGLTLLAALFIGAGVWWYGRLEPWIIALVEARDCGDCAGAGLDGGGLLCPRCDGSGVRS